MIKNKNKFKNNAEVTTILNALEVAIANKDEFSVACLIARLDQQFNLKIVLTSELKKTKIK